MVCSVLGVPEQSHSSSLVVETASFHRSTRNDPFGEKKKKGVLNVSPSRSGAEALLSVSGSLVVCLGPKHKERKRSQVHTELESSDLTNPLLCLKAGTLGMLIPLK